MRAGSSSPLRPGRWHEHRTNLGEGFELLVKYRLHRGQVEEFAVVLTRTSEEAGLQQICRYDNAHGFAHLDLLSQSGNLREKHSYSHLADQEALEHAIADLKANYQAYWDDFISS